MWFLWGTNWIPIYDIAERFHSSQCGGGLECRNVIFESFKRRRMGSTVSDETVMYDYWSSVTWPVSDCSVSYRPVLSSERASCRKNNKAIVTIGRIKIKIWSRAPKGSPIPRRTGRLTVGRKINSTQLNSSGSHYRSVCVMRAVGKYLEQ
jgi:hypothetical protein